MSENAHRRLFWRPASQRSGTARMTADDGPRTMRVDYFHTGNAAAERFSLDRVVLEPLPWPGNPRRRSTTRTSASTSSRSSTAPRTASSTPAGSRRSTASGKRRARRRRSAARSRSRCGSRRPRRRSRSSSRSAMRRTRSARSGRFVVDPKDIFIDTARTPASPGPVIADPEVGEPAQKVDFLILGDGYTAAERGKFEKDARRLADLSLPSSRSRAGGADFNVWALCPPAEESGISRPSAGIHRRSPDRRDLRRVRLRALHADLREPRLPRRGVVRAVRVRRDPDEHPDLRRRRDLRLYGTVAADSLWAPYVFVHEFGHHFAGLADEYYTSPVAYEPAADARTSRGKRTSRRFWTRRSSSGRTSRRRGRRSRRPGRRRSSRRLRREYQKRSGARSARRTVPRRRWTSSSRRSRSTRRSSSGPTSYSGKVGAFEGAMYEAKGYLPAPGRLHHVHPRRGAVLRGVPAGPRRA